LLSAFAVRTESATGILVAPGRVSAGAGLRRAASTLVVAEVALALAAVVLAAITMADVIFRRDALREWIRRERWRSNKSGFRCATVETEPRP
jgi:hypothetical protein